MLTLKLDLVLYDQILALGVNGLCELARHGMMGSRVFSNKTLVALNGFLDNGLLDLPVANILPFLLIRLGLLLRV